MVDGMMIDSAALAFDIDGVFADTMTLFLDIARDEFGIGGITYSDITSYNLEECLDIDKEVLYAIGTRIIDGVNDSNLKPITGAPEVLTRLGQNGSKLFFVTARPYAGQIIDWMLIHLPIEPTSIEVVPTGSFDGKADVLLERGVSYFVEDRLETCFMLNEAGIIPILFRQPWNRGKHPFCEVGSWSELESLITF